MLRARLLALLTVFYYINCQETCPCSSYDNIEKECEQVLSCSAEGKPATTTTTLSYDWPYLVSLQGPYRPKGGGCYRHFCGGALIAPKLVLTAAHCTDHMDMRFRFPQVFIAIEPPCRHLGNGRDNYGFRSFVTNAYVHPDFKLRNTQPIGDLAILVLNESLPGPYVKFPEPSFEIQQGENIIIAGYGYSSPEEKSHSMYNVLQLREVTLEILNENYCKFLLDYHHEDEGGHFNASNMLCAYDPKQDSCNRDGGGPAVLRGEKSDDDILLGLVSWGPPGTCTKQGDEDKAPAIFTNINAYKDWIEEIMEEHA